MTYRFFCTFLGVQTQVYPQNFKSGTKFVWEQEGDELFFREKLEGELLFTNIPIDSITDYDYFLAIEQGASRCEEISFLIQNSCDNGTTWTDRWNGYFAINEGRFEIDSCIYTVKINVDDKYRCYVENSENEYNINEVAPTITTGLNITESYEFYTCRNTEANCNASRPAPAAAWLVFHTEVVDGVTTTIYYREVAITACQGTVPTQPSGSGWIEVVSYGSCANGFAKWARVPTTVVTNNPNPDVSPGNCSATNDPTPPPRKKSLTVTKDNSTPTPVIIGRTGIDDDCDTGIVWRIPNNPGSTYLWSITGAGNTITGGGTTYEVTADILSSGDIKVIETTACGASVQASLSFTYGASQLQTLSGVEFFQRRKVCFNSVSLITLNYPHLFVDLQILSAGGTGSSLTDLGNNVYQFTAGPNPGTVTFTWSSGGVCAPVAGSIANPLSIIVGDNIQTPDILGLTTVCKSHTTKYYVAHQTGNTYTWAVTGGSIISGQGTSEITVTWNGTAGTGTVELTEEGCSCGWIHIPDSLCTTGPPFYWCPSVDSEIVHESRLVKDVLSYIAGVICGCHSCDHQFNQIVSDFFDMNPVGDSPGYVAGFNYVTGDVQKLTYLSITAKEIVLAVTSPANNGILTWSFMTKMLRDVFQAYWFVDDNNNVRIEHISWFQRTVAFNLTSAQYIRYKKRTEYFYDKIKMPKYERFSWAEAANTDFIGAEIRYDSICVSQDPKNNVSKIALDKVSTDIVFITNSPDDIAKSGFVLMVNDLNNEVYTVSIEMGEITQILLPNAHLSWANLHVNYWRHNRVLDEGYMNLALTNFLTTKRFKKQDNVSFPFCCGDELDPLEDLITTALGNGVIESAEVSNQDNMITVTLLFE